ncbi:MAG: BlaI/MecI/CopY family transcriptional regulator [Acidobacteria bacterium]|nr:BlaI/MecI/CopY family transcriptional regulator [Acidobacteriota bacterium]
MEDAVPEQSIGEQELALLRYLADGGAKTVGEVAEGFGGPRGLARSTVLTVMERLRRKAYVTRRLVDGVFRYTARRSSDDVMRGLVRRFVEKNLDGSVAPFVAYLSESPELTDAELDDLQDVVERLRSGRGRKGGR